jgi:hypothetical protein
MVVFYFPFIHLAVSENRTRTSAENADENFFGYEITETQIA